MIFGLFFVLLCWFGIEIVLFVCFQDNYGIFVCDCVIGVVVVIDMLDVVWILEELGVWGWVLMYIFNIYWYDDYIVGNLMLKVGYVVWVIVFEVEYDCIFGVDIGVLDGVMFDFGVMLVMVIVMLGYMLGYIVYYLLIVWMFFVGDILFVMGCGWVFEGMLDQMWGNMQMFVMFLFVMIVYGVYEYMFGNVCFVVMIELDNVDVVWWLVVVVELYDCGELIIFFMIVEELVINFFICVGFVEEFVCCWFVKDDF